MFRPAEFRPAVFIPAELPHGHGEPAPARHLAPASLPQTSVTQARDSQGWSVSLARVWEELLAWFKTLLSAAVYATIIVTFGFQVARVEGQSMIPTLEDQDRLIVNKLAYRLGAPRVGDVVMLYYPEDPDKSFVKRVVAEENDTIRSADGKRVPQRSPAQRRLHPRGVSVARHVGPLRRPARLLLRDGRSPEQQLGQPRLGERAEEIHHRPRPAPLVAAGPREDLLTHA